MDLNEHIENGKLLAAKGDYKAAGARFKDALKLDPENEAALFETAKLRYLLHEYPSAIEIFERLLDKGSSNAYVALLLAKTLKESGQRQKAIELYNKLAQTGKVDTEVYKELGELCSMEKEYDLAELMFENFLSRAGLDVAILLKLAQLYNFQGKFEDTKRILTPVARANPAADIRLNNSLLNELEIAENKTTLASKPRIMLVTLTNRCNLHCAMCGRGATNWDIPDALAASILSLLPFLELITWQGGEVFLYSNFKNILAETARYKSLHQIIITNGLLITEEWAELLVRHDNLDLTISIDSVKSGNYERLRPGGDFKTLCANIERINSLRTKYSSKMVLTLRFTLMKDNYDELEQVVEFCRLNRFDVLLVYPINEDGSDSGFQGIGETGRAAVSKTRLKIREKAREYNIKLLDWLPKDDTSPSEDTSIAIATVETEKDTVEPPQRFDLLCYRPWKQIAVRVSGKIYPECLCEEPVGDIFHDTFDAIWNSPKMQEYRKRILNGDHGWCGKQCVSRMIPPEHLKFVCE
jgi:MoaA/NifB/PqqE/SkfB family radical SAM enzyme/Flp pilus assembly protein TadD